MAIHAATRINILDKLKEKKLIPDNCIGVDISIQPGSLLVFRCDLPIQEEDFPKIIDAFHEYYQEEFRRQER